MSTLLAAEHKTPQRLKMIEQALKDQAPKSYRELKQAGKLKEFLLDHDREMIAAFDEAQYAAHMALPPQTNDFLETVRLITAADNRAWAETLSTFLEFSDPSEEETMQ
jgi:hypothetical protein